MDQITIRYVKRHAVITIDAPESRNAFTPEVCRALIARLTAQMWAALGARVREAATHPEVICTVVTGRGSFYSAGANVKAAGSVFATAAEGDDPVELRAVFMRRLAAGNADVARAMYEHPKLLVAALNGPAIGLSAGLLGYFVRMTEPLCAADLAGLHLRGRECLHSHAVHRVGPDGRGRQLADLRRAHGRSASEGGAHLRQEDDGARAAQLRVPQVRRRPRRADRAAKSSRSQMMRASCAQCSPISTVRPAGQPR